MHIIYTTVHVYMCIHVYMYVEFSDVEYNFESQMPSQMFPCFSFFKKK